MITNILVRTLCFCALCLSPALLQAKEVTLQHNGLTLNAEYQLAPGKTPADGVILITHGALAHRDMEVISYMRRLLKERGYNTLAINLSLGVDNRHGMYDCKVTQRHRNDDALEEIGLWIDWLKKQGAKHVTLLGHSRGGAQTALYASEHNDPLIRALVLMAPATRDNTSPGAYQKRYKMALAPLLDKARKLVNNGKGNTVLGNIGLMTCVETPVTASTLVSYYGEDTRVDAPSLIPKISKPTLVVVAGSDPVVVGLDKKVAPLADGKRVHMTVVEGAGHLFRDLFADDAADAIDEFLAGL
jgi:pimeloyl-ACP methyl ester carboxylesterase